MARREDDMEKVKEKSEPLLLPENGSDVSEEEEGASWMVCLSTFIAVCGSYEFGTCVSFFTIDLLIKVIKKK